MGHTPAWHSLNRKLVAILRGITPSEVVPYLDILIAEGFNAIEIPLNSPNAFESIDIAVQHLNSTAPDQCLVGAGTVLNAEDVQQLHKLGANLIVSPNTDVTVIESAAALGLTSIPGCYTATECFTAINAGATALKLFPASNLGPSGIGALMAVLPNDIDICAVGGIDSTDFADYAKAGVAGFGLGSCLYKSGISQMEFTLKASVICSSYDAQYGASSAGGLSL
jgi:2-dehydro-3-deoxyphosphogalactonate aldolase